MENHKPSNILSRFWKWTQKKSKAGDQTGSHSRRGNTDGFTRESRILDIHIAGRAVLTRQAESPCTAAKARNDATLERLGLSAQDATLPSLQPPPFPRHSTKSPRRGRRITRLSDVPRPNIEDINRHQRTPGSLDEEDDAFWDEVLSGSQMAVLTCKEAQMAERDESPASSLSSVDTQTPTELRAISLIEETTPPPPPPPRVVPLFRRGRSRIPVLSARYNGADKEVADGCRLQSAKGKVEAVLQSLKSFQLASTPSLRPPAAPKMTSAKAPMRRPHAV